MSKIAEYLKEHISGEIVIIPDIREHFSTDASIFKITPQIVEYPRNEEDVRKTARFSWQLAERGKILPITARGLGSDQGGAAIGNGIMLVFPAHMNKILSLNSKKGLVSAQPGLNYSALEQTLQTHGQIIWPSPTSVEFSTIGGAVSNNAGGQKTIKYGSTKDYVQSIRLVLSNGDVITTSRINKRELNKKKSQANLEGEIYRTIDDLLTNNLTLISDKSNFINNNNAGYDLWRVKKADGSFDLTPLIVGSQGTLGIITEICLETEDYNPNSSLIAGYFNDIKSAAEALEKIRLLEPSSLQIIDSNVLKMVEKNSIANDTKLILFVEFDNHKNRHQRKKIKKTDKIFKQFANKSRIAIDKDDQTELLKLRNATSFILSKNIVNKTALPIIEDGAVPPERFYDLLVNIYRLFEHFGLDVAVWGDAGSVNLQVRPFLDLNNVDDRQKMFLVMDAYNKMIIELGGTISGHNNDGRIKASYLRHLYGDELYEIFRNVKKVFDPYNILNPGVKVDVTTNDLHQILRKEHSIKHLADYLPRT